MSCCSVKCCRVYLSVFAVIIIIAGIVVCIFSVSVKNEAIFDSNDDFKKYGRVPFAISLSLGIILILTGLSSLVTSYKYNRIMRIILGCLSFSLFISFIVIGSLLIREYNEGIKILNNVCRNIEIREFDENSDMHNLILFAGSYDMVLMTTSNSFMCTDICPCKKADANLWNERELNYAGRTRYQYNDTRYNKTNQFNPLVFVDSGGYNNFYDCLGIDKMIDQKYPNESGLIPNNMIQIIKMLENSYHCNNFCQTSEFFLFRDITEGPPRGGCMKPIQAMLKRLLEGGGGISFFASFSSFFLLLGLLFNCRFRNMKDYEEWRSNQNQNRQNDDSSIGQFKIDGFNDIGYQSSIVQKGFHQNNDKIGGRTININDDGQVQVEYVLTNGQDQDRNEPYHRQSAQKLNNDYDDTQI
ncbi:tetraspanin family protein [Stylonychia lemnae]|uniref:Tetraspanin family protein n=1 Tax=Stylonychia lemnae TaxID=5949 RepID=A0A078A5K9_STYLE|nr:tetraspanin family protein [Stylonychia lemnae]|eukprot:CDW77179.1 tetraspanin family protein [Stylonychia lemnae]